MNHLEAAEQRANKLAGIDRVSKTVPFSSLANKRKRPRSDYSGPILGVDGDHSITDLPVAKRQQCYDKLLPALKSNRPYAVAAASPSSAHSAPSLCAALEFQAFARSHASSVYLGSIRTILQDLARANATKVAFEALDKIDWNKIPKASEPQEHSEEEDEESGSDSDSSEEQSAKPSSSSAASRSLKASSAGSGGGGGGGFISASSLASKGGSGSSSAGLAKMPGFAPASVSYKTAGIAGAKKTTAAGSAAAVAASSSSSSSKSSSSGGGSGGFRSASSAVPKPASKPLSSFFPPAANVIPKPTTPPKLKYSTALPLSFVYPVNGGSGGSSSASSSSSAAKSAATAGPKLALTLSSHAPPLPPASPARNGIQPLALTSTPHTPSPSRTSAVAAANRFSPTDANANANGRNAKRPRLELNLTTSP